MSGRKPDGRRTEVVRSRRLLRSARGDADRADRVRAATDVSTLEECMIAGHAVRSQVGTGQRRGEAGVPAAVDDDADGNRSVQIGVVEAPADDRHRSSAHVDERHVPLRQQRGQRDRCAGRIGVGPGADAHADDTDLVRPTVRESLGPSESMPAGNPVPRQFGGGGIGESGEHPLIVDRDADGNSVVEVAAVEGPPAHRDRRSVDVDLECGFRVEERSLLGARRSLLDESGEESCDRALVRLVEVYPVARRVEGGRVQA